MPNEKKVKNIDKNVINVLTDEVNSISHDRLVNSRSPVALELNGVTKGQSDIINFVLPAGSTIAPDGGDMKVTIASSNTTFVFRPGGTAQGNIYTDFLTLYTDLQTVDGPTILLIDTSLSGASLPIGTFDFSNTLIDRFKAPDYQEYGGSIILLDVTIGTNFSGGRLFLRGVRLRSLSNAPIMFLTTSPAVIVLQEGAELISSGASSMIRNNHAGASSRLIMDKSSLLSGTNSVIEQDVGSSSFDIYKFNGSRLKDNTLETASVSDLINVYVYDTGVECSISHSALFSPTTLVTTLKTDSSFQGYDGSVSGLASDNVKDAIDELKTLITGGGGVIPKKDTFIPTPSQTVFTLSTTPTVISTNDVSINGVEYDEGTDYNIVGTTLTWTGPFVLGPTDTLIIHYFS